MIISTDTIESLCRGDAPIIEPYKEGENKGNPAKIELHLGTHCYCSGSANDDIIELENDGDAVTLKPNTIFLFETEETIHLPLNLSGHMSLKMGLISKGLLMSSQTQVDPGYNNVLFGLIYNLSSREVELKRGQAITTLELFCTEVSENEYSGNMQNISFEQFVKIRINSSLGLLEKELRESQKEMVESKKRWDGSIVLITILLTVISVIFAVFGIFNIRATYRDDAAISRLELQVEMLNEKMEEYEAAIKSQNENINTYENRIAELEQIMENNIIEENDD